MKLNPAQDKWLPSVYMTGSDCRECESLFAYRGIVPLTFSVVVVRFEVYARPVQLLNFNYTKFGQRKKKEWKYKYMLFI